jgi:hypothetical protein
VALARRAQLTPACSSFGLRHFAPVDERKLLNVLGKITQCIE